MSETQSPQFAVAMTTDETGAPLPAGTYPAVFVGEFYEAGRVARTLSVSHYRHYETGEYRQLTSQDLVATHQGDALDQWLNGAEHLGYGQQAAVFTPDAA